jgi:hypothetical protein
MKKILSIFLFLVVAQLKGQQLNATVSINADKITTGNMQVFKTLQTSLTEFLNKTDWNTEVYQQHEKINCAFVIIVNSYENTTFNCTIQVSSTRPVFNSTYATPIFNHNDKDFSFEYTEFQQLIFNPNSFDSNLVSVLTFYAYMILGFDGDTYSLFGGKQAFESALQVQVAAQGSGYKGWSQSDGNQNRFFLLNDLLSGTFDVYREAQYTYNREGLDSMADDLKGSKIKIMDAIKTLSAINKVRPNAFLTRVFFDAKSDEIVAIFSAGPSVDLTETIALLNKISPLNATKWQSIKL